MEDGSREWQPVQEIVRLTFKSFNEIIRAQGEAIQNLERAMEGKTNKSESTSALAEKVNVTELTHTFEDLSRIIDSKSDLQENAVALERKAGRAEVQAALQLKADTAEVQRCLDQKANVEETASIMEAVDARFAALEQRMQALLEDVHHLATHVDDQHRHAERRHRQPSRRRAALSPAGFARNRPGRGVTPDATTRASKSLTLYIRATVAKSAVLAVRAPGGWRALGPS